MKKLFIIFVLLFSSISSVEAASSNLEKIDLGEIVFSPTRSWRDTKHTSENITVVTANKIKKMGAHNPSEALSNIPGIDVTERLRFGHTTPLSIQGSSSRHVLVMVDGIPFNTQASGQADILPALPLENIQQIEVMKGSASSAWGSSLGGVIDIITKDPIASPTPKGNVTVEQSEFRRERESVELTGTAGTVGYYFMGDYEDSGGARTRGGTSNKEDTLQRKYFGKISSSFSDTLLMTTSAGYSGVEINEGVYPTNGTWQHVPYEARFGQVRFALDPEESQHYEAALKLNRQHLVTDTMNGTTNMLTSSAKTWDNYIGGELKGTRNFREADVLVFGYDISTHTLKSSQMHVARDIVLQAPYVNYTWSQDAWDVMGGLRYDWNEEFGDQISPTVGSVYHIDEKTLFRANVSQAFHAPPLVWKYFEDSAAGSANNPDIKAERAWVYEAGVESSYFSPFWFKLSGYRSDVYDAIATTKNEQGLNYKKNFQEFRQQGAELESKYKLSQELEFLFAANFNNAEDNISHTMVRNRAVTRPSFRLGFDYNDPRIFRFNLSGRYNRWDSSPTAFPNDRKFIWDAKLSKDFLKTANIQWTGYVNGYNLTNSKYWSSINFPLPERYFEAGLKLDF